MNPLIFIQVCLILASHVRGLPDGAPSSQCERMTPNHDGASPQTTRSPFSAMLETTHGMVGTPMKITLKSNGPETFQGFLVQLRKIESNEEKPTKVSGTFLEGTDPLVKPISCDGKLNSAVTHNSKAEKRTVNLQWVPTEGGRFKIVSTFAQNYNKFWVNVQNDDIIEVHSNHEGPDNLAVFCSTLKLNLTVEPSKYGLPYELKIRPVDPSKADPRDYQTVEQKSLMWINITSANGTGVEILALQVRSKGANSVKGYGRFVVPPDNKLKPVDCSGGMKNTSSQGGLLGRASIFI